LGGFAQLNIPVFETPTIPLFGKLEASWRHDQYHGTLNGATSNPKIGFTWELSEDIGATIRGSWGTSFRFANAGEYSTVASANVGDFGLPASNAAVITIQCDAAGNPVAGSAAATVFAAGTFGCKNNLPPGLSFGGAPHKEIGSTPIKPDFHQPRGRHHSGAREMINYALGFELTAALARTGRAGDWYSVKINGTLTNFNNRPQLVQRSQSEIPLHHAKRPRLPGCSEYDPDALRAIRANGGGNSIRCEQRQRAAQRADIYSMDQ
jgi:hypothetical protein